MKKMIELVKGVFHDTNLDLIKKFEGCKLKAYKCPAGVWTIGYGHTKTAKEGMVITKAKAVSLLKKDLRWVKKAVKNSVTVPINKEQTAAIYSLVYNIGGSAWRSSTLLRKLNTGDYEGAGAEFIRWNKATGVILPGLVRRRAAETKLFKE
jgi:lysozyme